jgi:hypothetical protein
MIKLNKDKALEIVNALKEYSFPAYTNWTDYITISNKEYLILDSGDISFDFFFKKREFYFLKEKFLGKKPINYGIVFHLPIQSSEKEDFSIIKRYTYNYAELAFVKYPNLEPSGVGEIIFQSQSIILDENSKISVIDFLETDIPDKIKDIFLFNINELKMEQK